MIKLQTWLLLSVFYWATLISAYPVGAIERPKGQHPAAIIHRVEFPFERTWNAAMKVIRQQGGKIVTTDKPSGLIVYRVIPESMNTRIYLNILLLRSKASGTHVYIVSRIRGGRSTIGLDTLFFDSLTEFLNAD